jgi:hypothetical protein
MNTKDEIKTVQAEVMEKTSIISDINNSLPTFEVNVGNSQSQKPEKELFEDNIVTDLCQEILNFVRDDRKEIDEALSNFANMVMNEGDASTSSKEALVNLIKIKSETTNNMSRVLDLIMRAKLKERDTFPKYLAATQHNEIKIGGAGNKRKLIEQLAKQAQKKKEGE